MRGEIGGIVPFAVKTTVHVAHDQRSFRVAVEVRDAFEVILRDPLIGVHPEGVNGNIGVAGVERHAPIPIVPPIIQSHGEEEREIPVSYTHLDVYKRQEFGGAYISEDGDKGFYFAPKTIYYHNGSQPTTTTNFTIKFDGNMATMTLNGKEATFVRIRKAYLYWCSQR